MTEDRKDAAVPLGDADGDQSLFDEFSIVELEERLEFMGLICDDDCDDNDTCPENNMCEPRPPTLT
ncbi:MAG TPA: hypothetical protein VF188_17090 [Longimicrobiales bacterium]